MKKSLIALFLFCICSSLFAVSWDDFNFKVTPQFSILHGNIYEHVFSIKDSNLTQLSKLDWEIKAIPTAGGSISLDFFKYGHIAASGKIGFPCNAGNMQDYDWLKEFQSYDGELTNYSIHENLLKKYYQYSFEGGVNIPLPFLDAVITPVAGCEYEYIYFDGENGYASYKSNNYKPHYYDGSVISYQQEYRTFITGIKFALTPVYFLDIKADVYWAPFFNINDMDHHYERSLIFYDQMKKGNMFRFNLAAIYNFNDYNHAGFNAGLQYIPMVKGTTFIKSFSSSKWGMANPDSNAGGTSRLLWNFDFFYEVRF